MSLGDVLVTFGRPLDLGILQPLSHETFKAKGTMGSLFMFAAAHSSEVVSRPALLFYSICGPSWVPFWWSAAAVFFVTSCSVVFLQILGSSHCCGRHPLPCISSTTDLKQEPTPSIL
jgi:hypothetical protein